MKIPLKAFVLSLLWSFLISAASYFLLSFLCNKYAEFMLPFVFIASILICLSLCWFSAVHYKVFNLELNEKSLTVSKGFIIKREKNINIGFTVSVKTVSTPLMRILRLSNLLLLFEGSVCVLYLIKSEDAELIYESILKINEKNEDI